MACAVDGACMPNWTEVGVPREAIHAAERVRDAAFRVHRGIGPGFRETICRQFLAHELTLARVSFEQEVWIPVEHAGLRLDHAMRADMIVEGVCLVELKSVEKLLPLHYAQVVAYLKASGLPVGLLINFNVTRLVDGCQWFVHPDLLRKS